MLLPERERTPEPFFVREPEPLIGGEIESLPLPSLSINRSLFATILPTAVPTVKVTFPMAPDAIEMPAVPDDAENIRFLATLPL